MELSEVDEDELSYHLTIMKDRPRKCLQNKISKEVIFEIQLTLDVAFYSINCQKKKNFHKVWKFNRGQLLDNPI